MTTRLPGLRRLGFCGLFFLLAVLVCSTQALAQGDQWVEKAPKLLAVSATAGAAVDDKIYVAGGYNAGCRDNAEVYDATTDSWSPLPPLPSARYGVAAAAVGGKVYVMGGFCGSFSNELDVYDPVTNGWSTLAPMPVARYAHAAAAVGNKIYVIGGRNGSGTIGQVDVYDTTTDSWSSAAPLPTPRSALSAAVVNGRIYAMGGDNSVLIFDKNEMYDPATDAWSTKAPLPTQRTGLALAALNGRIYALGGNVTGSAETAINEDYDPDTDTWASRQPMLIGRYSGFVAAPAGGKVYAIGGHTYSPTEPELASTEAYSPPVCAPAPAGLVSWWKGEGNADDSADGNIGTLVGGASFSTGKVGQGFTFDGVSGGVVVPDAPNFDFTDFTLEAWIKTTDAGSGRRRIISQQLSSPNMYWVLSLLDNQLEVCSSVDIGCVAFTGQTLNDGQFHHVAITRQSGTAMKWYIDGVNVKTQAIPNTGPFAIPADVYIGKLDPLVEAFFNAHESFNGVIDEPTVFSRALSASEIQRIFNAGAKGKCPCTPPPDGMVAWWAAEGNAHDRTGINNGTLMNGAAFGPGAVGQAFSMNGAAQYVDAGNDPSLQVSSGDFTVDAWVRFDGLAGDMSIVDKMSAVGVNADGWRLIKQGDKRFWFCFGGGGNHCGDPAFTVFSTTPAARDTWFHVAAVKSSTSFAVYVNGKLEDSRSPVPPFLDTNSANLRIGSYVLEGAFLNGQVDEVELFHRALSSDEIAAIYNAGGAGKCKPRDLTCSKTASTSFDRTFSWSIQKSVDKTTVKKVGGGSATFNYTVNAGQTGAPADSNWLVTGAITVNNPNDWKDFAGVNVSDAIDNGGSCVVTDGLGATVPAAGSLELPYACTYSTPPSPFSGTNTATAAWDPSAHLTLNSSAHGTAPYAFSDPGNTFKQSVAVTDTFNSVATNLGALTGTTSEPFASATYTYAHTVTIPQWGCASYPNTAQITETGQTSSQTVRVCGPVRTGALTMGYWQNKNGQSIISSGAATAGVCNSGTWLRQYAPFQNLSATASCSAVASYVSNAIKAANSSGASMNAMLKGQMLTTALDVYFSDPGLGGNRIAAPAPIGGVGIDLTQVCSMIDSSTGSATCSGTYQDVSSAFGAASQTVSQMLADAASQSNAGGSIWYGNLKATQQKAKNAFDAVNNQVAFAP